MKLQLDPVADAAYFEISTAHIERTCEIEPGIIADDAEGHIVGIEVVSVTRIQGDARAIGQVWGQDNLSAALVSC